MSGNDQKAKFAMAVLHKTLQHFDGGGTVLNAVNPNTGLMGTLGGALGLNDNFQAGTADIHAGTNQDQLNSAYAGAQDALGRQTNFANAVNPVGLQGLAGQQQLLSQLGAQSQGLGPNPAQAQLAQNTSANTANQAALMAGQRGASANAGMIARQAAQQGALNQQNAVGQAATLGAQQQLASQGQLANVAGQAVQQQQSGIQGLNNAQQNEQNILQGANTAANNANVQMQSNINNTNAQTAVANQKSNQGLFGGVVKGLSSLSFAQGGEVKKYAAGGVASSGPQLGMAGGGGPQSFAGNWLNSSTNTSGPSIEATPQMASSDPSGMSKDIGEGLSKIFKSSPVDPAPGGYAADPTSGAGVPGATYASPDMFACGGAVNMAAQGGGVGGKANVKGDSYSNDTVPAMLSPGEVVIPRHVMQSDDPATNAYKFVQAIMAKKGGGLKK